MKKISNFIPNKIIKKKEVIDELDKILADVSDEYIKNKIHVINNTANSITIECDSSSVGSILKFERQKYLEIFKNYGIYNIEKLKIKIK